MIMRERLEAEWDGEWTSDGIHDHVRHGEHCDGEPTWRLWHTGDVWEIEYVCGWHEQRGEANSDEDAIRIMHAMVAAGDALSESLWAQRRAQL